MLPILAVLALAPTPTDVVPPILSVHDLAFGTSAPVLTLPPITHLGLVPGHTVRYRVSGETPSPGAFAILAAASAIAPFPLPLGTSFLYLDPAGLVVIGAQPLDAIGACNFDFALPATLTLGATLACQAATLIPQTGSVKPINYVTHAVTDVQPTIVATFQKSQHPSASTQGALVLQSPNTWQAFWNLHAPSGGAAPAIDFSTQVVVVGFAGVVPTTGSSLRIDALVPLAGTGLDVRQTLTLPGIGCAAAPAEQTPGQIVRVDRVAGAFPTVATTTVVLGPSCP